MTRVCVCAPAPQDECSRLLRLSFLVSPLLATVKRREAIRSELVHSDARAPYKPDASYSRSRSLRTTPPIAEPSQRRSLLQEYRKLTLSLRLSISRWERQNGVPFLYRGLSYTDDLKHEGDAERLSQHDLALKRALRAF